LCDSSETVSGHFIKWKKVRFFSSFGFLTKISAPLPPAAGPEVEEAGGKKTPFDQNDFIGSMFSIGSMLLPVPCLVVGPFIAAGIA